MKTVKHLCTIIATATFILNTYPTLANPVPESILRKQLLKKSVSLPSNKVETQVIKVNFAPGYKTPLHTHEGPGPRYVTKGQLRVVDGGENQIYKEGEVFWETGSEMTVENVGKTSAEIIIFQLVAE